MLGFPARKSEGRPRLHFKCAECEVSWTEIPPSKCWFCGGPGVLGSSIEGLNKDEGAAEELLLERNQERSS